MKNSVGFCIFLSDSTKISSFTTCFNIINISLLTDVSISNKVFCIRLKAKVCLLC